MYPSVKKEIVDFHVKKILKFIDLSCHDMSLDFPEVSLRISVQARNMFYLQQQ